MRARRLIAAASVAALGVLSLAACGKSAPNVAAYVGDTTFSVDRVDAIYDDVQAKYGEAVRQEAGQAGATPAPEQLRSAVTRQDVVNLLVSLELGRRVAAGKNLQVPDEVTPQQLEQNLRVPASTEYAKLWGDWIDLLQVLNQQLPPAELSDDSMMAVYHALEKTGAIKGGLSVAEVRQAFGDGGFVRAATALSTALGEEATKVDVSVNPRYQAVGVPSVVSTGQSLVFYSLPYINEHGSVTDISTPEPLPSSAAPEAEGTAS
ncbi:hypothetical protein DKT68_27610 [Micromonospora acroterricola]|uniref:SurA N-terminal domain-containing protein n=1 Tax=Micromonospora acroterricola TaxID=2202421 RepID=A0A317CSM2_9ACTN|nr:hypothetical protein [Micromonospora acroterricola]PWR05357.1 hypothetical protein DKT68_27610 [Micromonospora acroterricola]